MRTLVTGGGGFIGSNLVDALVGRGDEVLVVDDFSTGRRENLAGAVERGVEVVEADVRDAAALRDVFERFAPDAIAHLAAQIDVRRSATDPAHDAAINVVGTINVLEAVRAAGGGRVVYVSTGGAIYGDPDELPATEDTPALPEAPYGQSKLAAEGYCALFQRTHGLSTLVLRLGNVYGPRQDPLGEAGVVAIFCGRILAGERPTVFGDGRQTRDYVHVDDVVAAVAAAIESDAGGVFNIGTGVETSVLELVAALAPHAHAGFEPIHEAERPGEVIRIALDSSRARAKLGWEARVAIDEGIAQTLAAARASG